MVQRVMIRYLLHEVVVQRILVALLNGKLNAFVPPKTLESIETVKWHGVIWANVRICGYDLGISLSIVSM